MTELHVVTTESRAFVDMTTRRRGTPPLTENAPGSLGDRCRNRRFNLPGGKFNRRTEKALADWSGTLEEVMLGPAKEVFSLYRGLENDVTHAICTILTSRYGPIAVEERIIPYWGDDSLTLPMKWLEQLKKTKKVLLAIPATQLRHLAQKLAPHLVNAEVCVVSGKPPGDQWFNTSEVHVRTRGVARVGHANYPVIKNWLKGGKKNEKAY